jgi:hypothetical protein
MSWEEVRRLADSLFFACALHLPAATVDRIAREFATIFAAHGKRRSLREQRDGPGVLEGGDAPPERDVGTRMKNRE